jgi:hypothetical protein
MNDTSTHTACTDTDDLAAYVAGVCKLPEKLAIIAANQRGSELSLGRAAAALRSMAALNRGQQHPELRNHRPDIENVSGAFR